MYPVALSRNLNLACLAQRCLSAVVDAVSVSIAYSSLSYLAARSDT
jgi:hypothetical protein